MGNRAVIVSSDTNKSNANKKIGVYVHWHGSEDTIKELLQVCKDRKIRGVMNDPTYGWARLCQAFADVMTEESLNSEYESAREYAYSTGIGIGIVSTLDTYNYDNGVYYIDDNFDIVKHTNGSEFDDYLYN